MALARAKASSAANNPSSAKQQRELVRTPGTGEYTIAGLAELFTVSRTTVYRALHAIRRPARARGG